MQPKSRNIIAFLQSKGWTLAETTAKYFLLQPPPYIQFEEPFHFRIPRSEAGKDTPEYLLRLAFKIAEMYELDKFDLLALLSKNKGELRHEIEAQQRNLEMKQSYYSAVAMAS